MNTERVSRILIVEDNPIDREIYKRCLQRSRFGKFEFAEADSGASGIYALKSWRPDCTLLDFNLPDMDGIDVLARIQDETGRVGSPVVMLTAFGDEALAVRAMKAGAADYLPKGQVTSGTLRQTIVNAMERFEMQQRIDARRSALAESGRRYQVLLEAIPEIVWTADGEGRVQYANHRWSEYTGLELCDGVRLGWDQVVHPDDRERSWRAWENSVATGAVLEIEHRLRRAADGGYRWHLVRAVPMGAGNQTTWFGTCTDIEDQKQAEREMLQKQKLEGIGMLAAGVAHDFNNLLVGILGGASYAMDSLAPNHPAQPMLRTVVEAGERAADLTRKMLAYAGKGAFYMERTDLDRLVHDTCRSLEATVPHTITFDLQPNHKLPAIETDPMQLRHVVTDLIVNAVEAIGEGNRGTITVRTESVDLHEEAAQQNGCAAASVKPGRYVAVEVRDTGCGMDEETQKRVFDPFFSTKFAGRGLGLAAVEGFVRSSGGRVVVESTEGQGSCFRVLLPEAPKTGVALEAARVP